MKNTGNKQATGGGFVPYEENPQKYLEWVRNNPGATRPKREDEKSGTRNMSKHN
ncbi:MAG TPA: hypothetical protein PK950_01705 [Candidatus Paceibacterota bacterium]|nr:hypothetical protein [Candidatus Paceibacterota bacterium]